MAEERFLLPGSERTPRADALPAGTPAPSDVIEVSLMLRPEKLWRIIHGGQA